MMNVHIECRTVTARPKGPKGFTDPFERPQPACKTVSETSSSSDTDEMLGRLLHEDPHAWTTMVREYSGLLISVANRVFAGYGYKPVDQDAEDVVAAAWSNVLAHDRRIIRQCLKQGQWLATLYTLVRNRAIDVMRSHKLATIPLDETYMQKPELEIATEEPEIQPQRLREAMNTLNVREQTMVSLFFLQGKKYSEIAALKGVPQNSIGPTIWRALSKLRKALR